MRKSDDSTPACCNNFRGFFQTQQTAGWEGSSYGSGVLTDKRTALSGTEAPPSGVRTDGKSPIVRASRL